MTITSFINKHFYPNLVIQLISIDTWFSGKAPVVQISIESLRDMPGKSESDQSKVFY